MLQEASVFLIVACEVAVVNELLDELNLIWKAYNLG